MRVLEQWVSIFIFVFSLFHVHTLYSMQPADNAHIQQAVNNALGNLRELVGVVGEAADVSALRANESLALAHNANGAAIRAFESATQALERVQRINDTLNGLTAGMAQVEQVQATVAQQTQAATTNLGGEYERLRTALNEDAARVEARVATAAQHERALTVQDNITIERARIDEMVQHGVYEQTERIRAGAALDVERERWRCVQAMLEDPHLLAWGVFAAIALAFSLSITSCGVPVLMKHWTKPHVICETSQRGWLARWGKRPKVDFDELIFNSSLQEQVVELVARVQAAAKNDEPLPNVLFYGAPGTGKTACVRALAYASGFEYALTSGSEFIKITNLHEANNELRKLLQWAQSSDKGLIVFIDEAESLFANRLFPSTPKITQDFINTFLTLVSEQSQKKVMFIFATNQPFKIDDAILNRVGVSIGFTLPEQKERERILAHYLEKFAQENKQAVVTLSAECIQKYDEYASKLDGFSPRAIKYIAEEMIINARHQEARQLTDVLAQVSIERAKNSLEQMNVWKKERDEWAGALRGLQQIMQWKKEYEAWRGS